jgi:hypothetical protein
MVGMVAEPQRIRRVFSAGDVFLVEGFGESSKACRPDVRCCCGVCAGQIGVGYCGRAIHRVIRSRLV